MFDELLESDDRRWDKEGAFEMLKELEQNTPEEIRRQRTHFRVQIKARITITPANTSAACEWRMQGTTGDLSEGGCRALLPAPIMVGDVYRLEFDRTQLDLPLTFVRCVRCLMLAEERFEVGFRFFSLVSLPDNLRAVTSKTRR
ncbi:MAG: PilZ domain-containing protein [Phycisphaerae bacterium]|nr:PilZ domain-containing protein [Phycisphaerae bacterium]